MTAPPQPIVHYNIASVICSIGNVVLSSYGEDGGISVAFPDIGEVVVGADGVTYYVAHNDSSVVVEVKIAPITNVNNALWLACEAFKDAVAVGGATPPVPFSLVDPATGFSVRADWVLWTATPSPALDKKPGEVTWKFTLPYATRSANFSRIPTT